jgi:two-component system sensor histidine kinase QseC
MPAMAEARGRSIRRALLVGVLAAVATTWLATAVVSYLDARHELDELLDAHLAQTAALLIAQTGHEPGEVEVEHSARLHRYERRVAFQFWEDGKLLRLHSANAPNDARLSKRAEGFSDTVIDGRPWRVFGGWDEGHRFLVQVGERREARDEIVAHVAKNLLWPLAVALPVLGVLIWLWIDRALRPLRRIGRDVGDRAPDNLAPLVAPGAPSEVAPLVAGLNRLFARVRASMDNERRFTADAAHELRTPLAAVRAQAQVALRAGSVADRQRALDNVIAGCDRAAHLVEQLLTLARLEPAAASLVLTPCDLVEQTRSAVAEIVPAANAKQIDIELAAGEPVIAPCDARLLQVLLRNVLDNALRYSPAGSSVKVSVDAAAGAPRIAVADQGPGVPPGEVERLGQRFHRVLGNEATGTGLGLSISRRIAQVHRARLSFLPTSADGGLTVVVEFPPRT